MLQTTKGAAPATETKVVFLMEKPEDGFEQNVFAYFPDELWTGGCYASYAHIGQHSACSPDYARECALATPEQYQGLLAELVSIGYDNLKIVDSF